MQEIGERKLKNPVAGTDSLGERSIQVGWKRILPHLSPQAVRRLLVEHDEMRSEIQRLQVTQASLDEARCELQRLRVQCETIARIQSDSTERTLLLQGQLATHTMSKTATLGTLADTEFQVFSQWGEDGIIEWLV
jgi:hypothetical protein